MLVYVNKFTTMKTKYYYDRIKEVSKVCNSYVDYRRMFIIKESTSYGDNSDSCSLRNNIMGGILILGKIKKDKAYIKAVRYYEECEIEKAIKKCEESISDSLKNSSALNLKGLLLYLKGDLEGAVAQWKINSDF
ncbi:MAG TPA: hypothetical protein VIK26_00730, partial [Clostridium sp.]